MAKYGFCEKCGQDIARSYYEVDTEEKKTCRDCNSSCAASPWIYRTDTGDKHGKVVENAEFPEKDVGEYVLIKWGYKWTQEIPVPKILWRLKLPSGSVGWSLGGGLIYGGFACEDYLRKHLIAFAEIQGME